ncbi:hypothetical protein VQ042_24390 [Aurantimonas sp. A2-1-M11]|uniref:hypothetical protein n=1 Tax=Aurantimonas sp. A2-1-M11 TaxID=3113712 RepID=UPI002F92CC7B
MNTDDFAALCSSLRSEDEIAYAGTRIAAKRWIARQPSVLQPLCVAMFNRLLH